MSTIRANSITNSAGTGAPDFPNGLTDNSNAVLNTSSSLPAANLTGTLPALDGSALTNLPAANLTGTLPAINGSALTNLPAPTTAQVGTATAGLAVGAVGTYAFMWIDNTSIVEGSTYAGSSLTYASMCDDSATSTAANTYRGSGLTRTSTTGSGTWRAMGAGSFGSSTYGQASLFLRIS